MSYTYATVFLIALLIARALAPFVGGVATRIGAVDLPASRKVHRGVIPRLGGIALIAGMIAPLPLLFVVENEVARQFRTVSGPLLGVALGLIPIVFVGILDDLRGASALVKFPIQTLAAVIAYALGCRIDQVSNPFADGTIVLGAMALPATILWIVVVTNAINLIDGLDGLATGITAFVAATLFTLSRANENLAVAAVAVALCGAAIGFLRYNFPPASIFLGDTGSLSAGYLLGCISILGAQKSSTAVALFVPVVVLGVPLFDTITSFSRRLLRRRHPFRADAEHIHHRILARGFTQLSATLMLYAVTGILMVMALLVAYFDNHGSLRSMGWTLFATAAFLLSVGGLLGYLNVVELRMHAVRGVHNRRLQRRRRRIIDDFRRCLAEGVSDGVAPGRLGDETVWALFVEHLEMMDFQGYELRQVAGRPDVVHPCDEPHPAECFHARAIVVRGMLQAQLTAIRPGSSVSRAHDSEALDELILVLVDALERPRTASKPEAGRLPRELPLGTEP